MLTRRALIAGVSALAPFASRAQSQVVAPVSKTGVLTSLTVVNNTGVDQINIPLQLGLPLAPGALPSGSIIQVHDGATALAVQEDNRCTDFHSSLRHTTLTAILPSLAKGQTKVLTVHSVPGRAATGTAIAWSDVFALCGGTFEPCKYTIVDQSGATYVAAARSLSGAGSTWSVTDPVQVGTWQSGPYCTCLVGSVPFAKGGSAHDYARLWVHIYAYKTGSGAVTAQGGANPITALRIHAIVECGYAQQNGGAPAELYYACLIERSTSLTVGKLATVVNWTNDSTSPGTLTIGAALGNGNYNLSRASGGWSADDYGRVIAGTGDGLTGLGKIVDVTVGGTSAKIWQVKNFSSNTLASGRFTMYGVGQPWDTRNRQVIAFGTPVAHPESTQITPYLGWSGTGNPGLIGYLAGTRMVLNYSLPVANLGATAPYLNLGTRPYRSHLPAANYWHYEQASNTQSGGDKGYIGVCQACDVEPMIRYDANGQARFWANAEARLWNYNYVRDKNTGHIPAFDGADWSVDYRFGTQMVAPAATVGIPAVEDAHTPGPPYMAWLISGDLVWSEACQAWGWVWGWANINPGYGGSRLSRNIWLYQAQQRQQAWGARSIIQAWAATPDRAPILGIPKSHWKTLLENSWAGAVAKYVAGSPADRIAWTCNSDNGQVIAMWMCNYAIYTLHHGKEVGCLDGNGVRFLNWWQPNAMLVYTDNNTSAATDWMAGGYKHVVYDGAKTYTSLAEIYRKTALSRAHVSGGDSANAPFGRPGGKIAATLSAASGSSITVQFADGTPFRNGGSWYVGGWVSDGSGYGQVTAVDTRANSCVISTAVPGGATFAHTSIPAANLQLPWPHPQDAGARGSAAPAVGSSDYLEKQYGAACLWQDDGVANAAAAAAYYLRQCQALAATDRLGQPAGSGIDSRFYITPRRA